MKQTPAISVIMPVYNGEPYVYEAVDSILNQTFTNFEFIIIDDASTDKTRNYLDSIKDARVKRINNNIQSGNYRCRNQGLNIAKGRYVCMMDSDDIAYSHRFEIQHQYMEDNLQYLAVGSDFEWDLDDKTHLFSRLRNEHKIKAELLSDNMCTHPTLIIRREVFYKYGIFYNETPMT